MSTNHTVIKNDYWQNHLEEIDRLKAELEVVRFDNNILRDQISTEAQVEHKRYEEWRDTLPADTAMPVASWHILKSTWMKSFLPAIKRAEDLERQLAEARAEIAALNDAKVTHYICGAADARQQARQEAAREIIQYIIDQGIIEVGWNKQQVYEIDRSDIDELRQRYGLEG